MTLTDMGILLKKILVGFIIYLIPVCIIVGSLFVTKRLLQKEKITDSKNVNIIINQ